MGKSAWPRLPFAALLGLAGLTGMTRSPWAAETAPKGEASAAPAAAVFAARAELAYHTARTAFLEHPTHAVVAWEFGRACFDWAEFATNNAHRALIAADGMAACRSGLRYATNLAALPYYLGLNLGQLARVKRFTALGLITQMRDQFEAARRLDERFDFAGPDRNLGLLYAQAPGWPLSLGDRGKARRHLQRAVTLAPDYPENRLNLLEALADWGDWKSAQAEAKAIVELLPRARRALTGDAWELSWVDWNRRWVIARRGLEQRGLTRTLETPAEPETVASDP